MISPADIEGGGGVPPPPRIARTTSPESKLTGDEDSKNSVEHEQEETSTLESQATESMPTEWTDEKHSLYIKSMEASFVNQLYKSFDSVGWPPRKYHLLDPKSSRQMHAGTRISSGQYKVLRDGCWATVNFGRDESQLNKEDGSHVHLSSPWIRHFRSGYKHQTVTSPALQEKAALAATSNQFRVSNSHLCHHDSVGSNTEVTDQNFVDEDVKRENTSTMCGTKRMKSSVAATSNDQVVPFFNFPLTKDVADDCVSPKQ